ncbi:MAG: glycosyltransferase family 2 protein [Clostridia bacterium]|nr:glycosyltransferase family 2 protein [Clostridia bacterium]
MAVIDVIIPVYNTAREVLGRSLGSVRRQSFVDWRAIVVDDGSRSETAEYLDSTASEDPRFLVIHQKNAGASAARNRGLDESTSPYVSFVDSDDELSVDFFQDAIRELEAHGADLYVAGIQLAQDHTIVRTRQAREGVHVLSGEEDMRPVLDYAISSLPRRADSVLGSAWMARLCPKVFRREIACRFRLNTGVRISEDSLFAFETYTECQTIVVDSKIGYTVNLVPNSLSRDKDPKRTFDDQQDLLAAFSADRDRWTGLGFADAYRIRLLMIFLTMHKAIAQMTPSPGERYRRYRTLLQTDAFREDLPRIDLSAYVKAAPGRVTRHKRVMSAILKLPGFLRTAGVWLDSLFYGK